jgi:hypothetical protein
MSDNDYVYIFYSAGSYQPMGIFRSKAEAIAFAKRYCVGGNIAKFKLGMGLVEYVITLGANIPEEKRKDPKFISQFSSSYVVRAQVDSELKKVMDWDTNKATTM